MDFTSRVPVVVILKNKKGNIIKRKGHLLNEKGTLYMKKGNYYHSAPPTNTPFLSVLGKMRVL